MKCFRTVCNDEGKFRHRQNGDLYCFSCARKINSHNPGLIIVPDPQKVARGTAIIHTNERYAQKRNQLRHVLCDLLNFAIWEDIDFNKELEIAQKMYEEPNADSRQESDSQTKI